MQQVFPEGSAECADDIRGSHYVYDKRTDRPGSLFFDEPRQPGHRANREQYKKHQDFQSHELHVLKHRKHLILSKQIDLLYYTESI